MDKKLIYWSEKYSIGYEDIDNQHKRLVDMINVLFESFKQGEANTIIENILKEMINYADYHFKTEERVFRKYNYSGFSEHSKQHRDFTEQVTKFYDDFKAGSVVISYKVMSFLREWLINHIQGSDKKYVDEFKKQNIYELAIE